MSGLKTSTETDLGPLRPDTGVMETHRPLPFAPVRVDAYPASSGFERLRSEWDALWAQSDDATESQSWEWQFLYWKHLVFPRPSVIVVARTSNGECAGIAVLAIQRDRRSWLPVLGFQGEHDADCHQILHRSDVSPQVGHAMLDFALECRELRCPRIELCNVPVGSWTESTINSLWKRHQPRGFQVHRGFGETYTVRLPATMDQYVAEFRARTKRSYKEFESGRRALFRNCRVEFRVCANADDLDPSLDAVEQVDRARWNGRSRYCQAADRAFHRSLSRALCERGLYRAFLVYLDDHPAAYVAGFRVRNSFRVPTLAHDPSVPGRYSIGRILNVFAIEQCIQEGCQEYDLTRGSEEYKKWLGGELRQSANLRIYRTPWARLGEQTAARAVSLLRGRTWLRRVRRRMSAGSAPSHRPDSGISRSNVESQCLQA